MSQAYKDSGVDIKAADALIEKIKPFASLTKRPGADASLGGFGGLFDLSKINYKDPVLVSSTDGVGTKLLIAIEMNNYSTIGIDLVAMNVNDILAQKAEPLFFLDYYATGSLDVDVAATVIKGIADGCLQAGCALIGGETAEMPKLYKSKDFDLAGFAVGVTEKNLLNSNPIQDGDVIIGIMSNGLHSNGFSLIHKILNDNNISLTSESPNDISLTLGETLLSPTRIYVQSCLPLIKDQKIKALAHITGGGLTDNLQRILPDNVSVIIDEGSWKAQNIFKWILDTGQIKPYDMTKTFNCGIGMVLIIHPDEEQYVIDELTKAGETAIKIGDVEPFNQCQMKSRNLYEQF